MKNHLTPTRQFLVVLAVPTVWATEAAAGRVNLSQPGIQPNVKESRSNTY